MSVVPRRSAGERIAALHGPALWTMAGLVLYIVGGLVSLLALSLVDGILLAPFGLAAQAGELGLSVRNGLHAIAWGLLTIAVAAPLGRRLIPGIRFRSVGWSMLAVGLVLAAVVVVLGAEFVRARYGVYDPEYQGLSFFAGPALVAVALATWAALAVPRDGIVVPGAAMLTAGAGLAMSLLPSLPGAADGVQVESLPIVLAFLAGVGYTVVAAVTVIRRLVRAAE
ncbi:MAG TPA: hypothetical protein VNL94_04195 [Candidatus Binatia bacterium]|nr:hypothetical protein [Candidatus Binatia bacterium]